MQLLFSVSISGFGGQPATLLCSLDDGVLVVAQSLPFREGRANDKQGKPIAMVTNLDLPDRDFLYTDELMRDAIRSYYNRESQNMIDIVEELARFRPENAVEKDQIDEKGPRYRLAPEITNGQIAVLAAVAFADQQSPTNLALGMMDELTELFTVTSI